jgi:NAD(P)-dependent dehydrogenase (short-subunit alcohol dehydrogenase family)
VSSKAGLVNLTRCLAIEWQPLAIRVNAAAPSFVCTPLKPRDVAATLCFLASEVARMITGQVLAVDGGWNA